MLSKFLNNNKKKQGRNRFKNIHENCYLDINKMKENFINHVDQSKKMKKSDCFIQEDASNFLIIPESRNPKCGIMRYYSESD
ncbi:hypothetical protein IGK56_002735 [Enterococcus sp. AZ152]